MSTVVDAGLRVRGVVKTFHTAAGTTRALDGVDLDVARGQFVTLFGPSGCGKSTLLRVVAGLAEADAGEVSVLGQPPARAARGKQMAWVPQSPALLPWRSVLDNVRLPGQLNRRGSRGASGLHPVDPEQVLREVGLGANLASRPAQLSGGMQQRVAIARAFAQGAPVLLMDEPFSALDEITRESVRLRLLELWELHGATVLFVTHSTHEAVLMSDRVMVMGARPGRILGAVEIDLPRPRTPDMETSQAFLRAVAQVKALLREGFADDAA